MNILNFIRTLNPKGGGPMEAIRSMSVGFHKLGSRNEVLTLDDPAAPWLRHYPVPVHAISAGPSTYGYTPRACRWLNENKNRFDAIISHGIWNYPSLATWRCLGGGSIPWFVVPHGSLDPWFNTAFPAKRLKKVLYWRSVAGRIMADATGVLFTSDEEMIRARRSFSPYGCWERRVEYGVRRPPGDPAWQRDLFLSRFPGLAGKRLLLSMGRIVRQKGCDVSIGAFAAVANRDPALHLVFAGPDQIGWKSALQQEAARLGVAERITWTGTLDGDLKWGAFHASEAFLLPSHMENFGIVVAESLACAVPVLISRNVQIWQTIVQDGAGIASENLVPDTTRMLNAWLDLDSRGRLRMRARALDCFNERFEIVGAARSWLHAITAGSPSDATIGPAIVAPGYRQAA